MYQFQVTQDDLKKFGTRNNNNHNEDSKSTVNVISTINGGENWSVWIDPETKNQSVLWLRDTVDSLKIANKKVTHFL